METNFQACEERGKVFSLIARSLGVRAWMLTAGDGFLGGGCTRLLGCRGVAWEVFWMAW